MRQKKKKYQLEFKAEKHDRHAQVLAAQQSLRFEKKMAGIDLSSLGGLFFHYRPLDFL